MIFERTEDLDLVREILTTPACWRRMANDHAPDPDAFRAELRPDLAYVIARQDERVLALFVLKALSEPWTAEVHFCFRPSVWGSTEDVARAFVEWIWKETSIDKLVGPVPGHNRLALNLALKIGFQETRREIAAVPKRGKLYDRIILTYRREAGAHREQEPTPRSIPPRQPLPSRQ